MNGEAWQRHHERGECEWESSNYARLGYNNRNAGTMIEGRKRLNNKKEYMAESTETSLFNLTSAPPSLVKRRN